MLSISIMLVNFKLKGVKGIFVDFGTQADSRVLHRNLVPSFAYSNRLNIQFTNLMIFKKTLIT